MSLFDFIYPTELITLVIKVIIIIVLGLVTVLGAYLVKGKIAVVIIAGGVIAILVVWFMDLEGIIHI